MASMHCTQNTAVNVPTVVFEGIEVRPVDVQVQVAPGMPAYRANIYLANHA
jgi:hypothetical protein